MLGILDNRAATYTKLGQYDRALKDARHMIKNDKQDERVWLCRQVFRRLHTPLLI